MKKEISEKEYQETLKRVKARAGAAQKAPELEESKSEETKSAPAVELTQITKLPMWIEAVRGVPNGVLRSALFGAIKKGARAYLERREIHAQEGIRIEYTGARLDQGDLDVWETVLHIARVQELGHECRVTAYQMLKLLGKTDAGKTRDTLERRLSRLKATALNVKVGQYSYMGSLIDEVYKEEKTREYVIRLNPKLGVLFEHDQFTQVDWAVRQALDGHPLAQWLHGYYSSHAKPFPVKVETLLNLAGSEDESPTSRKQTLRKALEALKAASKLQPFDYEITADGMVFVKKTPTPAQRRHLRKPKPPKQ